MNQFLLAGSAVDDFIDQLLPVLSKGDIIIDGGNSEYTDTQRRCKFLASKGLYFVGAGVRESFKFFINLDYIYFNKIYFNFR